MSRERLPYKLEADLISSVLSSIRNSSSHHGSERSNFSVMPISSTSNVNIANMPIYEDPFDSNVLNRNYSQSAAAAEPVATSSNRCILNSSALESLQNYGRSLNSPVHFASDSAGTLSNFSKNIRSSASPFDQISNHEQFVASNSTPFRKHFSDLDELNLKSVDEEDEFLYGDSNSLPEAPKSFMGDSSKLKSERKSEVEWSDDEFLEEFSSASQSKMISRCNNASPTTHIKAEAKRTFQSEQVENTSFKRERLPSVLDAKKMDKKSNMANIVAAAAANISKDVLGIKSKYHAAAQILKKQTLLTKDSSTEKLDIFSGPPTDAPNLENKLIDAGKNTKSSEKEKMDCDKTRRLKMIPKSFIDNLNDYRNEHKKLSQKRPYPDEDHHAESKYPRHLSPEKHRSTYESSRYKSSDDYRHRSPYHSRYKSPERDLRYRLSSHHSRHRSPDGDYDSRYEPRHHSYEKHGRHTSPTRTSREKSPGYLRYKDTSHRIRDRSKSPSRRSYEDKYTKSSSRYPEKSSDRDYSKSKRRSQDSDSSFCSLSLASESDSSSDSSDNSRSREKKNSRDTVNKTARDAVKDESRILVKETKPEKAVNKITTDKMETLLSDNLSRNMSENVSRSTSSDNTSRSLCDIYNPKTDEEERYLKIGEILEGSKLFSKLCTEVWGENSHMSPVPPITEVSSIQTLPVSSPHLTPISDSQQYPYPTMPPVTMPYPHHTIPTDYPPMLTQPVYHPASLMPPIPSMYDPYSTLVPSADPSQTFENSECRQISQPRQVEHPPPQTFENTEGIPVSQSRSSVETKYPKKSPTPRPTTLRTISLSTNPSPNLKNQPKPPPNTAPDKTQQKDPPVKESTAKNKSETATAQSPSGVLTLAEHNKAVVEKCKDLKFDKYLAQARTDSAVHDLMEMRKMMSEAWGKKVDPSDKVIYSKCKALLTSSQNTVDFYFKEKKRLEEEITRFMARQQSSQLRKFLGTVSAERTKKDSDSSTLYIVSDSKDYMCYSCNRQYKSILGYLHHIQDSSEHKNKSNDKSWVENLKKKEPIVKEGDTSCQEVQCKGIEFIKPVTGLYCTLCNEIILDDKSAEQHLLSHNHYVSYKNFIQNQPLYIKKSLMTQFVQYSANMKQKRKKEIDAKLALAERRKVEIAADQKVKQKIKEEMNSLKYIEELEDDDDSENPNSNNQKAANIKLTLSGEDSKTADGSESPKDSKLKAAQKLTSKVLIGKAPNFRKASMKKLPQPWYKRESILNKGENEPDTTTSSPSMTAMSSKSEKSPTSTKELKNLDSMKISSNNNKSKFDVEEKPSETVVKYSLSEKTKGSKSSSEKPESKQPERMTSSASNKRKERLMSSSANANVNQAIKNILLGADASAHDDISLSQITLPNVRTKTSSQPVKCENKPVPMDIDNSQDPKSKPKLSTEEDKDLFILGINKDDLKPLVIPVPPPSSIISYSNGTSKISTVASVPVDFSVPPPNLLSYSQTTPPPTQYSQSAYPYSNQSNVMSNYPASNNATAMYPYSNQNIRPPIHQYPPPYMYSTASNMPSVPTFSNQNSTYVPPLSVPPPTMARPRVPPPSVRPSVPPPSVRPSVPPPSVRPSVPPTAIVSPTQSNVNKNVSAPINIKFSKRPVLKKQVEQSNLITITPSTQPQVEKTGKLSENNSLKNKSENKESTVIDHNKRNDKNNKGSGKKITNHNLCTNVQNSKSNKEVSNSDQQKKAISPELGDHYSEEIKSFYDSINVKPEENSKVISSVTKDDNINKDSRASELNDDKKKLETCVGDNNLVEQIQKAEVDQDCKKSSSPLIEEQLNVENTCKNLNMKDQKSSKIMDFNKSSENLKISNQEPLLQDVEISDDVQLVTVCDLSSVSSTVDNEKEESSERMDVENQINSKNTDANQLTVEESTDLSLKKSKPDSACSVSVVNEIVSAETSQKLKDGSITETQAVVMNTDDDIICLEDFSELPITYVLRKDDNIGVKANELSAEVGNNLKETNIEQSPMEEVSMTIEGTGFLSTNSQELPHETGDGVCLTEKNTDYIVKPLDDSISTLQSGRSEIISQSMEICDNEKFAKVSTTSSTVKLDISENREAFHDTAVQSQNMNTKDQSNCMNIEGNVHVEQLSSDSVPSVKVSKDVSMKTSGQSEDNSEIKYQTFLPDVKNEEDDKNCVSTSDKNITICMEKSVELSKEESQVSLSEQNVIEKEKQDPCMQQEYQKGHTSSSEDVSSSFDPSSWLKSLRLHKYFNIFKNMTFQEIISITEEKLEKKKITKCARSRIFLSIQKLKEKHENLKNLEKDTQDDESNSDVLNTGKSMAPKSDLTVAKNSSESETSYVDPTSAPSTSATQDGDDKVQTRRITRSRKRKKVKQVVSECVSQPKSKDTVKDIESAIEDDNLIEADKNAESVLKSDTLSECGNLKNDGSDTDEYEEIEQN